MSSSKAKPTPLACVCLVLCLVACAAYMYQIGLGRRSMMSFVVLSGSQQQQSNDSDFFLVAAGNLSSYKTHLMSGFIGSQTFTKRDWSRFQPIISCPATRPLTKYGQGDGSKLLCRVLPQETGRKCIIYSLGSGGDFQFERLMLTATQCQLHTFDCTMDGYSIDKRHHFHKWCLGNGTGQYRTWANVTKTLGHSYVDLLKMDIEGHEYPVLASFQADDELPKELAMEVHVRQFNYSGIPQPDTAGELALVFLHMANLGYAAYSQEVNPLQPLCSEFTFMRLPRT